VLVLNACLFGFAQPGQGQSDSYSIAGTVVDEAMAALPEASVTLSDHGGGVRTTTTNRDGSFQILVSGAGSYALNVSAPGFEANQFEVRVGDSTLAPLQIAMNPKHLSTEVTVTAVRNGVAGTTEIAQIVTVRDEDYMSERSSSTLGNVLEDNVGIEVQQTTYGQVSPMLRGLTGYHVLNLIDGIRFNNSTFRSGPNQYLAFIDPSQVSKIETVLGPSSSLYGSDSLGGTINVFTHTPTYSTGSDLSPHFSFNASSNSADLSGQGRAQLSLAGRNLTWILGGTSRRLNDLRAGGGDDSRNIFQRYFDLPSSQVREIYGSRLQDTGFSQLGAHTKLMVEPGPDQRWTVSYQGSQLNNVRQYRNLFGGRARQQAAHKPERLGFFYTRYEKSGLGPLDSVSGTFSINAQRTGSELQNERSSDTIRSDRNSVNSFGYSVQASTHFGSHSIFLFGGDVYNEHISASRFDLDPTNLTRTEVRPLYPNGSRYTSYATFAEGRTELFDGRVNVVLGGRLTRISVNTFASRDPFGVPDSEQQFSDFSFNTAVGLRITPQWRTNLIVSRGFRAPNMNDLGAIGQNSLGYEIPASEAAPFGALIGQSAGEDATSTGRTAGGLVPESLYNYEAGLSYDNGRVHGRVQVFDAELYNPIVRRTLLFPSASVPANISGLDLVAIPPTPTQEAAGVVAAGTTIDPLALKAFVNDGRARYYGVESRLRLKAADNWTVETNYSFMVGRQLNPNRNARRLVPQMGTLKIRYTPGSRLWVEVAGRLAGSQERLSGGDISDARIGQSRSRRDIARVFNATALGPWIGTGADQLAGTDDDVFTPTGETVDDVQNRILPIGSTVNGVTINGDRDRAPRFLQGEGWFTADILAGIRLGERTSVNLALTNLLDRNYRVYGSGVDSAGVSAYVGFRYSF
jgi:outer membrane receptor protein involved in Fe transport